MKVREDVCYNINYSLMGKILLVGIKGINSFAKLEGKYITTAINFIDKYKILEINPAELDRTEKKIFNNLNKIGYLDNGVPPKESFNEFKSVGKLIYSLKPKNILLLPSIKDSIKIFFFIMCTLLMIGFVAINANLIPKSIDYVHMKAWEIIFTIGVFPGAILFVHELGHCFMAKCLGVKIDNIAVGWFFIYPLVLVQYYGLNLEKQSKKILVMAGGVFLNFVMAFGGILLKVISPDIFTGAVIDIWISANISTIITNLGLFGMTDGYFIASILIGIMDIRLKGYKYLSMILNRKDRNLNGTYKTCGIILIFMFVSGLVSLYVNLSFWLSLFGIPSFVFLILFSFVITFLTGRFFLRIKKCF